MQQLSSGLNISDVIVRTTENQFRMIDLQDVRGLYTSFDPVFKAPMMHCSIRYPNKTSTLCTPVRR